MIFKGARVLAVVVLLAAVCGCSGPRIVRTYAGEPRDFSQIARLYETPAAVVTRIDDQPARSRDLFGRISAYDLLPGRHEIVVARPGDSAKDLQVRFTYDFVANTFYGFRVTQLRRDDGTVVRWEPRLVNYETAQELAVPVAP